ncbi:MAG: prepilin-type N-terminal cleavage/methylation domain-containing protein [Anaerolineales bacterium]|nr:MAG: prepilin-type N-terminal cleavage/methylation domain-containing protein [Anaerolineales bacterium]
MKTLVKIKHLSKCSKIIEGEIIMFKKLFNKEDGFTLVELLVTIAILAVLFGITTLTLSGVGANAKNTVCLSEVAVVQSAMDIYLAADATNTIAVSGAAATISEAATGFQQYLRGTTKGLYTWAAGGDSLLQTSCP